MVDHLEVREVPHDILVLPGYTSLDARPEVLEPHSAEQACVLAVLTGDVPREEHCHDPSSQACRQCLRQFGTPERTGTTGLEDRTKAELRVLLKELDTDNAARRIARLDA